MYLISGHDQIWGKAIENFQIFQHSIQSCILPLKQKCTTHEMWISASSSAGQISSQCYWIICSYQSRESNARCHQFNNGYWRIRPLYLLIDTYNLLSLNDLTRKWFAEGRTRSSAVGITTSTGRDTIFLPRSSMSIHSTSPTRSCSGLTYVRQPPVDLDWDCRSSLSSSELSSDIESSSSDSDPDLQDVHAAKKHFYAGGTVSPWLSSNALVSIYVLTVLWQGINHLGI